VSGKEFGRIGIKIILDEGGSFDPFCPDGDGYVMAYTIFSQVGSPSWSWMDVQLFWS
jgi:hypothetical protein